MAYTSLKARIFASASANAGLQALLGTNPFQWGDMQEPQPWNLSTLSAVIAFLVSNPKDYIAPGPMHTSSARMQLTIFGNGNDSQNADAVAQAIFAWLPTLDLTGIPNQAANFVVGDKDAGIAQTQPLTYQRIIDVMIYYSDDN